MALALADILRMHWGDYARNHRSHLCAAHYRAVRRVLACRTAELGGKVYRCGGCSGKYYAYHSCNHRNCPQCGSFDQQSWASKQESRLLVVPYFMITFTIPSELKRVCLRYPQELYALLLQESAASLKDVMASKHSGAKCGFTSVLHTWGRQMQHHPHVHSIVPAVGYHSEHDRLIRPNSAAFLVHFRPLAARFRNRMRSALQEKHPEVYAELSVEEKQSLHPKTMWNVQVKHVGKGHTALRYLARYVHRSAFHPKRLLGYDVHGRILLRWTCSQTCNVSVLKLQPHEFIRRWLMHVLPKGFARVRHYGFFSAAAKKVRLRVRVHLGQGLEPPAHLPELAAFCCESCGGELIFLHDIKPLYTPRGPPVL